MLALRIAPHPADAHPADNRRQRAISWGTSLGWIALFWAFPLRWLAAATLHAIFA